MSSAVSSDMHNGTTPAAPSSSAASSAMASPSELDYSTSHPLHSQWTMSMTLPSGGGSNWLDSIKKLATFGTAEEFWGLYEMMPQLKELELGTDYNLFRGNIKPAWEDPDNKNGGKWTFEGQDADLDTLSKMWLDSCLFAIGEVFAESPEDANDICGIVVSVRNGRRHKIALWNRDSSDVSKIRRLGEKWKAALQFTGTRTVSYIKHQVTGKRGSNKEPMMML